MGYLAPSILSADLLNYRQQIETVEKNGADYIHIDVMDGNFVPNITFGPVIVKTTKQVTNLPLDVHLMIVNPDQYVQDFSDAGADLITVHQEVCTHLDRTIAAIKTAGCKAGASLNPATPVDSIKPVLAELDLVLIMSVNPGFGAQKFIPYTIRKIEQLAELRRQLNADFLIEVDGGMNPDTAPLVLNAGADILVAGNAIFKQESIADACKQLKSIILAKGHA